MIRLLLAVVTACLVLAGCDDNLVNTNKGYVSGDGHVEIIPVDERVPPDPIEGSTLDGNRIALSDFRGKTVVMPVWGSWCGPCRKEAPMFQAASEDLAARGVAFLGVNVRDTNEGEREAFIRNAGITYPSIDDQGATQILRFKAGLSPKAMPAVAFIDDQGRVAAIVLGEISRTTLYGVIEDIAS